MENSEAFYTEMGRRIRRVRERSGLTQDALASLVSLTRTSITNIEKGRQKILVHTLVELATALKVSPLKLIPQIPDSTDGAVLDHWLKGRSEDERAWAQSALSKSRKGE